MNSTILRSPNLAEGGPVHVVRLYDWHPPARFRDGGLASAARATRSAGRGGDDVLLHINPEEYAFLKQQWGEPSTNPHTGLPEYGLFSKIKKALKFEAFNVKNIVKGVIKNPQRLLTGAVDPLGTKISNKMFGSHYDPLVNQLGGATEKTFQDAEARGMDTGLARNLHKAAGLVAGFYGGNALGNLASWGAGNAASDLAGLGTQQLAPISTSVSPIITDASQLQSVTPVAQAFSSYVQPASTSLMDRAINTGAGALSKASETLADPGAKAIDYAKDPRHWGTIAKGAGALGLLGGAAGGNDTAAPPEPAPGVPMPDLDFNRRQRMPEMDWYTYGERPEENFYADNTLPTMPVGKARGGALSRHVRGPGSGRSDSIPARLSDGEYVLTAEDVSLLGDGSNEAGAKRLDKWRKSLRKHKGSALAKGKISPNAKPPASYLRGAS